VPDARLDRLVHRQPTVDASRLVAGLIPPPLFASARFDTYRPDPAEPSQAAAVARLGAFAHDLAETRVGRGARPSRLRFGRRAVANAGAPGIYLDGGFGVGKTHLLAALWHAVPGPAAYVTFVELTHLVGALGFAATVDVLAGFRLLAIDEFELDDPGDTVLVSTLLARLTERGVAVAATSNTVPEALGEGRFAAEAFRREIQALASRFDTVHIDGPDYRHRDVTVRIPPRTEEQVRARAEARRGATLDDFGALLAHLTTLHPSRYRALVDGVSLVGITHLHPVTDEAAALRLVVLIDRLYDRQIPVAASGVGLDEVFPAEILAGGYRKKYLRALSRMGALAGLADG
jgi:cell division protein ZapE